MWRLISFLAAALLAGGVAPAASVPAPAESVPAPTVSAQSADTVQKLAIEWFDRMRTGEIDRTQLTADFSAQLTDATIRATSRYLQARDYVASPATAKLVDTNTTGDETFYVVKLFFPRGNVASLRIGFDADGKISDISLLSAAGD
jgi:hypothetical protein